MAKATSNLDLAGLGLLYDALVKSGEESLHAAYNFGLAVEALRYRYTFIGMADSLKLSVATVSKYAKLYRKYARVELLVEEARRTGCYDTGKLACGDSPFSYTQHLKCNNCGSDDILRERVRVDLAKCHLKAVG